jgi:hypothetical protein
MGIFVNDLVKKIYSLPKTKEAVTEFLNSYYDEVSPSGKVRKRQIWERFEAPYVKVTRHYVRGTDDDEADIYIYAHKLISRCVLAEVSPYFESDGQLFSYFQLMVRNTRINNSVKADKNAFLLVGDMLNIENGVSDTDLSNFEETVMNVNQCDKDNYLDVLDVIDNLKDENGCEDEDLILFGRLFVNNGFSFDGMYGLCGFDLVKFKTLKKRFVQSIKKHYENEM